MFRGNNVSGGLRQVPSSNVPYALLSAKSVKVKLQLWMNSLNNETQKRICIINYEAIHTK